MGLVGRGVRHGQDDYPLGKMASNSGIVGYHQRPLEQPVLCHNLMYRQAAILDIGSTTAKKKPPFPLCTFHLCIGLNGRIDFGIRLGVQRSEIVPVGQVLHHVGRPSLPI